MKDTRKLTRKRAARLAARADREGRGTTPTPLVRYHPDQRGEFVDAMDAREGKARAITRPFASALRGLLR